MTRSQRSAKLRLIERLTLPEIAGWRWMLRRLRDRPFDGEERALDRREAKLREPQA